MMRTPILLGLSGLLLVASACATSGPFVWVHEFKGQDDVRRIQAGDTIAVAVKGQQDLSGSHTVRPNGAYAQPVVGEVPVDGLTEAEAARKVVTLLKGIVVKPRVQVTVIKSRPVRVSVIGEVVNGGQFTAQFDESVLSLLARARGLSPFAKEDGIYVVRRRPDLIRVRFRYQDLKAVDPASTLFRLHDGDVIVVE